jgi:hypothetical protein
MFDSTSVHFVIDRFWLRAHYVETTDHSKLDEIGRGHIVGPAHGQAESRGSQYP